MKHFLFLLFFLTTTFQCVSGQNRISVEEVVRKAGENEKNAQFLMGRLYHYGTPPFPKDPKAAIEWFTKAAEQGHQLAQHMLVNAYLKGIGVKEDKSLVAYWLQKLAESGNTASQCDLALCYFFGDGVDQNKTLAAYWFRKAAESGYIFAQSNLGQCFFSETEFPRAMNLRYIGTGKPPERETPNHKTTWVSAMKMASECKQI